MGDSVRAWVFPGLKHRTGFSHPLTRTVECMSKLKTGAIGAVVVTAAIVAARAFKH
jgi:hypothetical protein